MLIIEKTEENINKYLATEKKNKGMDWTSGSDVRIYYNLSPEAIIRSNMMVFYRDANGKKQYIIPR